MKMYKMSIYKIERNKRREFIRAIVKADSLEEAHSKMLRAYGTRWPDSKIDGYEITEDIYTF